MKYDDHLTPQPSWLRGEQFETLRPLAPDCGCQFEVWRMVKLGYTRYQDFKREKDDYITRWWFLDLKAWHNSQDRLEGRGYEAISPLKVATQ